MARAFPNPFTPIYSVYGSSLRRETISPTTRIQLDFMSSQRKPPRKRGLGIATQQVAPVPDVPDQDLEVVPFQKTIPASHGKLLVICGVIQTATGFLER